MVSELKLKKLMEIKVKEYVDESLLMVVVFIDSCNLKSQSSLPLNHFRRLPSFLRIYTSRGEGRARSERL